MEAIEVKLSDIRVAKIKKGKGADLFKAQMLANNPAEVSKLLLVFLTEINGKSYQTSPFIPDILTCTALIREGFRYSELREMTIKEIVWWAENFSALHEKLSQEAQGE